MEAPVDLPVQATVSLSIERSSTVVEQATTEKFALTKV